MSEVICGIAVSLDGFVAGNGMAEGQPFGDIPPDALHKWMVDEPERHQQELAALNLRAGAYIMGRNMFGPRGAGYDRDWRGTARGCSTGCRACGSSRSRSAGRAW